MMFPPPKPEQQQQDEKQQEEEGQQQQQQQQDEEQQQEQQQEEGQHRTEGELEVVFSDWEATNVGPALWDLAYLTTLSQAPPQRRQRQPALLAAYLAALAKAGGPSLTPEDGKPLTLFLSALIFQRQHGRSC